MKRKYFNDFTQGDFAKTFSEIAAHARLDMLAMKSPECWIYNEHIS